MLPHAGKDHANTVMQNAYSHAKIKFTAAIGEIYVG
jgi:hypothetical protein